MIPELRSRFNSTFSEETYNKVVDSITEKYNYRPTFKIAETPVFIGKELKDKLIQACNEITDTILRPDFKELSQGAVLAGQIVPEETDHTTFLQMDFGICIDDDGNVSPQLIEAQGFPSLYFFQHALAKRYREHYDIDENYDHFFDGIDEEKYVAMLRNCIAGDENPENCILLEIEPEQQNTAIDFIVCKHILNVPYVCVSELICEGKDVFYKNEDGRKIQVKRIFNRVIFDELLQRDDLKREFYFTKEHNVTWVGHPHWFFRISKHTLPLLESQYVPKSFFLNELKELPTDLENYVLKPLYSFAGSGVMLNLNQHDLNMIPDKENYILQRKVKYAPVVDTLDVPAKLEIRMLMLWERGAERPVIVTNLCRLSKGAMIGVKYNKDKTWVGGSVGFFEKS